MAIDIYAPASHLFSMVKSSVFSAFRPLIRPLFRPHFRGALAGGLALVAVGSAVAAPAALTEASKAENLAIVDSRMDMAGNVVEYYDRRALGRFFDKWIAGDPNISIGHFGDSHIQTGWILTPLRGRFQAERGDGGRGMIFPYAIAKTYSQDDYTSAFSGVWKTANSIQQPPKMGVGVSGFVAATNEVSAGFSIRFTKPQATGPQNIRLYFQASESDYIVNLSTGNTVLTQDVSADPTGGVQMAVFPVEQLGESISVYVTARDYAAENSGRRFALHGLDLRSAHGGLVYHNLGVGGAAYKALLQQKYFEQSYAYVQPDLVVLDWGTNDLIYTNAVPADHADTVRRTIARIRAIDPDVTIVLTSVQDMAMRGRPIDAAAAYSYEMRQLAREENCLFFDWYRSSGQGGTMPFWYAAGLASKDQIHLNGPGYRKRGAALADALFTTLAIAEKQPDRESLIRQEPYSAF